MTVRRSKIALVAAKLRSSSGPDVLLLRLHEKWGDYSLIGGHVEADESDDWLRAAVRETTEEMQPLVPGIDFSVSRLPIDRTEWGPVSSRSASGEQTMYEAEWFALRFLAPPDEALGRVDAEHFVVLALDVIEGEADVTGVSSTVVRLRDLCRQGLNALPAAWPSPVDVDRLGIGRLDLTSVEAPSRSKDTKRVLVRH